MGLFIVEGRTGQTLDNLLYLDEFRTHHGADPLRLIASHCYDTRGTYAVAELSRDNQLNWRTLVKERPSILDALGMFLEILSGDQPALSPPGNSSWNSRERVALSGVMYPGAVTVHHNVRSFVPYIWSPIGGDDIGAIPIDGLVSLDGNYIHADAFFDFVERFTFQRSSLVFYTGGQMVTNSGAVVGPYVVSHYETRYQFHDVSRDSIRYTVEIIARGIPNGSGGWYGMRTFYTSTISRVPKQPWNLVIMQTDGPDIYSADIDATPPNPSNPYLWLMADEAHAHSSFTDEIERLPEFHSVLNVPVSIMSVAPGLFHTQSKALSSLLGEVSKNFESFVEAPGFFQALFAVASSDTDDIALDTIKGFLPATASLAEKVKILIRLVCGVYIGWIFAINPALASARDAYERLLKTLGGISGKGSMRFSGTESTFESLPEGLRELVSSVNPGVLLVRYEIRIGSQIMLDAKSDKVVNSLTRVIEDAGRFGIEPNPVYLYQAIPFSFVFDWGIPMGSLMNDAYNRYKLIGKRGLVAGHSLSMELQYDDGLRVRIYLRSEATYNMIDPQAETWLQSSVPAAVAIPLAALLLL